MCPPTPPARDGLLGPPPAELQVVVEVEVPKGGFVKRLGDGTVDFVSPVPCPFNYGALPDTVAADGDRDDAVLLGPRRPAGERVPARVWARVRFVDAGDRDDKLVCGHHAPTRWQRRRVLLFFTVYARCKVLLNRLRGKGGVTRLEGWDDLHDAGPVVR